MFEIKKTDQGGSLPVRWTIPWLIMNPQEIVNLRGFSKLKEGRDWRFELELTKNGNLLSVKRDTTPESFVNFVRIGLKNGEKCAIISCGLV